MLTPARFQQIAAGYSQLRVALVGDFCLDRYLEIDPQRQETSIETGRPVHNVTGVRAQPGGAGTILNNLAALGVGEIFPLGFCGDDGEGYELTQALQARPAARAEVFLRTPLRRTFTYCKPLVMESGKPPRELDRLDSKNWTPTPREVENELINRLHQLADRADAVVLLDQADVAETGVVTSRLLEAVANLAAARPKLWILADSRRGLNGFPPVCFKMNLAELTAMCGETQQLSARRCAELAGELAVRNRRHVFVTLGEQGMVGAAPDGAAQHVPSLATRGTIDIVGAGDCVTANLTASLAAGASVAESLQIASAAASVVIHQLGTTGTAAPEQIANVLAEEK